MTAPREISFTVNGDARTIRVEPRKTLADAIREDCGLTGTHLGCEHGVCGACTILLDGAPVRSCLMFAAQAEGAEIRTVEGLAKGEALHPLQQAFIDHHALQCGFCTPGFLMLAVGVLEREPDIDEQGLREALASNLCRCTGYLNILDAVKAAAAGMRAGPG
ncbi:MAG: (2Fe-2S)-binding protein [Defluviicoccus sp.]|nr:(2Fe-2S)-binding protein [Defluviicoccus sp.]